MENNETKDKENLNIVDLHATGEIHWDSAVYGTLKPGTFKNHNDIEIQIKKAEFFMKLHKDNLDSARHGNGEKSVLRRYAFKRLKQIIETL